MSLSWFKMRLSVGDFHTNSKSEFTLRNKHTNSKVEFKLINDISLQWYKYCCLLYGFQWIDFTSWVAEGN